jgi:glutathione S-transferase
MLQLSRFEPEPPMSAMLDVTASTLASTLRLWRGTLARPAARQPAKLLELYDIENCPYCRLVREALTELDLDALILPCPKNGERFRPRAKQLGGKAQFPFLVDPNSGQQLYESADIVEYLFREYSATMSPARLLHPARVAGSMFASAARAGQGQKARTARAPRKPLELFSFESSPFSRRVRELLCELEIRYVLRSTGKALWQDMGPPGMRRRLFPELPVEGRNRQELLRRAGKVQVPYLADPNTGTEMFESEHIRRYLLATYAA